MDKLAGVLLIGILIAAWMFRWEFTPTGAEERTQVAAFRLDRWTGRLEQCRYDTTVCTKYTNVMREVRADD
jgi:hypothetical protein